MKQFGAFSNFAVEVLDHYKPLFEEALAELESSTNKMSLLDQSIHETQNVKKKETTSYQRTLVTMYCGDCGIVGFGNCVPKTKIEVITSELELN